MPYRASGRWRSLRLLLNRPRGFGTKCLPLDGPSRMGADDSATPGCTLSSTKRTHCSRAMPRIGATHWTPGVQCGLMLCPLGESGIGLPAPVIAYWRTAQPIELSDPNCELGEGGISRRASPTPACRPADEGLRGREWGPGAGGRGVDPKIRRPSRAGLHFENAKGERARFVKDKAHARRRARFSYYRKGQVDSLAACRSLYGRRSQMVRSSFTLAGPARLNYASSVINRGGQSRVTSGGYRRANACGYRIPTVSCTVRGWWFMTAASSSPT
nr:MAG: hypothetical protein [Culex narnavirus 1]